MMGNVYSLSLGEFDKALEVLRPSARVADADSKFVDSLEAMTLALAGPAQRKRLRLLESIALRAVQGLYFTG